VTHAHTVYKIPHGKLVKITLEYDPQTNLIQKVNITGDFFIHPEDGLELLETSIQDTFFSHDVIIKRLDETVTAHHLTLIGVTTEGLTEGILRCRA